MDRPAANVNGRRQRGLDVDRAGAATAYAVLRMGAERLRIFDTVPERAQTLCARLAVEFPDRASAVARVEALLDDADGLIHATPTGIA